ncbi:MAG: hypothetical protein K0U29_02540 [Gammaproteobacteria bacterium]|nr:hypothetical protein [Gammaproteobacteria bacterium]MCH9743787.1 hypothetical protein [Gammaproteobacteria bacterium]
MHKLQFGNKRQHHVFCVTGAHDDPRHIENIKEIERKLSDIGPEKVILKIEGTEDGFSPQHNHETTAREVVYFRALAEKISKERLFKSEVGVATVGINSEVVMEKLALEYPEYPIEEQIFLFLEQTMYEDINMYRRRGIIPDGTIYAANKSKQFKDLLVSTCKRTVDGLREESFGKICQELDQSILKRVKVELYKLVDAMIENMLSNSHNGYLVTDGYSAKRVSVAPEDYPTWKYFENVSRVSNSLSYERIFVPLFEQLKEEPSKTVTIIYLGAKHIPIYESFRYLAMQTQLGTRRVVSLARYGFICASTGNLMPHHDVPEHVQDTVASLPCAKTQPKEMLAQIERATIQLFGRG